jgi:succinoglycan biosynthesis transport protein ExoP
MTPPAKKKSFDIVALTSHALSYVKHVRLMVAMASLGILAGLVYYVYGTPIYMAKSLVYVKGWGSPVRTSEVAETMQASGLNRAIMTEFSSRRNIILTAVRMGLVGKGAVWEDVLRVIPSVQVGIVDSSHMEVAVMAKDPKVVREFCAELVLEYRTQQEETWSVYRDAALERYAKELEALNNKAGEGLRALSRFERDGKITESTIEQSRLNDLPREIVVTKELIGRMAEVRKKLESLPRLPAGEMSIENIVEELSALTAFERDRDVKVGDLKRKPTGGSGPVAVAPDPKVSTEVIVQPGMVETLQPWQELEKERRILLDRQREAAKQFLPGHRVMLEIAEELDANERGLRAELAVLRQRFDLEEEHEKAKLVILEARMPEYHRVNEQLSISSQEYTDIEKDKQLWDRAREQLASKVAVVTFSEDRDWVEMRFKGHTSLRDEIPVSPDKMKLVMISLLLAVGGALGVPTLVNLTNTTASTLQQLEESTGFKGIGVIPHTSKEMLEDVCRSPAVGAKVPNFLLENFRLVRSHIILNPGRTGKTKVVMVTSARPSEGKSSQASNLAWAFQSMGARTLIVDCDLRRGRQHGIMGVSNEVGMTTLLQGKCSIEDAIQKTNLPLMDVIPRGSVIVGTTDLLVQKVFSDLVAKVSDQYDQIILDTPPVLGLSETANLQQFADGVVMVVRAEVTPLKDVIDASLMLRKADAHIYGIVLNDLDLDKVANYYNYYYYSASYYEQLEDDV